MRNWESDVALYLLAGFLVLALFLVEGRRLDILQSLKMLLSALV
jgi:hypothetical protein